MKEMLITALMLAAGLSFAAAPAAPCVGGACAAPAASVKSAKPVAPMKFSDRKFAESTVAAPETCSQVKVAKRLRGEHDLAYAMAEAKRQKKFLFIQLGRTNCTNCQKVWNMLGQEQVKLPKDFLYADVSTDDPETYEVFEAHFSATDSGWYYPFIIIMGPDGSQLAFRSGLGTPEVYNNMIKQARIDYNTPLP